jgi:hypothetical protein
MKKIKTRKMKIKALIIDNTSSVPSERKVEKIVIAYEGKDSINKLLDSKEYSVGRAAFRGKVIHFLYDESIQKDEKEPISVFQYGENDNVIRGKVIFIGKISESGNPTSLKKDEYETLEEFNRPHHLRWEEDNLYQGIMGNIERTR